MKKLSLLCAVLTAFSARADDDQLIELAMQIYSNDQLVSEPRVAARPGTDASLMQGVDAAGFDEELILKVLFHAIERRERGAEMLVDADFGLEAPRHLSADHLTIPWNEPYEFSFRVAPDAPTIRVVVTPSLVEREEFLQRRE